MMNTLLLDSISCHVFLYVCKRSSLVGTSALANSLLELTSLVSLLLELRDLFIFFRGLGASPFVEALNTKHPYFNWENQTNKCCFHQPNSFNCFFSYFTRFFCWTLSVKNESQLLRFQVNIFSLQMNPDKIHFYSIAS